MTLRIWLNPACSKCRGIEGLVDELGLAVDFRLYLEQPPTLAELEAIAAKLEADGVPAAEVAAAMLRKDAAEKGVDAGDRAAALAAIAADPSLLQRPIVEDEARAVVARPPELLHDFLGRGAGDPA